MLFFTIAKVFIFSFTGVCLTVIAYIPYWVNVRYLAFLPLNCPIVMIFFILWFGLDSTKRCSLLCVSLNEVSLRQTLDDRQKHTTGITYTLTTDNKT